MAKNEIELHGEISTGSLFPGGKFGMRLHRSWESRREGFIDSVVNQSGSTLEELEDAFERDERLGDIFVSSLDRAVRVGDGFYRSALARLVAAAVDRSTPIDTVEALVDRLLRLDVASLRLLHALYRPRPSNGKMGDYPPSVASVLRDLEPSVQMVEPALAQLEAAGFLEREWNVTTSAAAANEDPDSDIDVFYERTKWGQEAFAVCLAHDEPPPT